MLEGDGLFGGGDLKADDGGKSSQLPTGLFDDEDDFKKEVPSAK